MQLTFSQEASMGKLSATLGGDGILTIDGGPVPVRCYGWVDVDQDEALVLESPARQSSSERGHRFAGVAELDRLRVIGVERFGDWTALVLPRGSRLLVGGQLALPPRAEQPVRKSQPPRHAERQASLPPDSPVKQAARTVAGVVLALVLLDLFGR
jgi:hypothetical protein